MRVVLGVEEVDSGRSVTQNCSTGLVPRSLSRDPPRPRDGATAIATIHIKARLQAGFVVSGRQIYSPASLPATQPVTDAYSCA